MSSLIVQYKQYDAGPYNEALLLFTVSPIALGHRAGLVFTMDGWATTHWAEAHWCSNDSYHENWEIAMTQVPAGKKFWFALWAEDWQGARYWDNNGGWNYEIYHS